MADRFVRIRMDPAQATVHDGTLVVQVFLPVKGGGYCMADLVMVRANDAVALAYLPEIAFEEATPNA